MRSPAVIVPGVELVGLPEIARMLGKHPQTVQDWNSRGGVLPEPEWIVANRVPVWRKSTIVKWAQKHNRPVSTDG